MKTITASLILLTLFLALIAAGCTQPQAAQPASQPASQPAAQPPDTAAAGASDTVKLMNTNLGKVLTDAKGMTLYYFITDTPGSGSSTCYAAANCSRFWPVFYTGSVVVSPPLDPADFSSIARTDGAQQTTYYGWPLYYFLNDKVPGDVKGENVLKTWYVARPDYTVMLERLPATGTFLTDGQGKTLYYFAKDAPGAASCTGTCLDKWPAFNAGTVVAPSVLKPSDFTSVSRTDGVHQTAYMGRMLYYFTGDTKPGDTNGQGVINAWYVANITGYAPPVPTPVPTTVPTTQATIDMYADSGGGGGGGY